VYSNRPHQSDADNTEEELPLFARHFFHYFEWESERRSRTTSAREHRRRNVRVDRYVIGQQAALSSGNDSELLPTSAERNRIVGTGEIAGDIGFGTIDVSPSGTSSSERDQRRSTSPRRRTAPHRRGEDERDTEFIGRRRLNHNDFGGVSPDARLHPSTSRQGSVDVGRMERGFHNIAASLNNLAGQSRDRLTNVINDDIIKTVRLLKEANDSNEPDDDVMDTLRVKIADLKDERLIAREFDRSMIPNATNGHNNHSIDSD
jgi:hypothetical protein